MQEFPETELPIHVDDVEWCFAVPSDRGLVEIRIRSNGEVVWMGGPEPVKWVCTEISFPTAEFKPIQVVRNDIQKIDGLSSLDGTDLAGRRYIYHYTRAETAIGKILSHRCLRMSPYVELNDPREAKEWLFTVVAPQGALPPGKSLEIGRSISEYIQTGARVLCFCSDGFWLRREPVDVELYDATGWRHPNMWAHYGENHCGVALAFDREKLLKAVLSALGTRADVRYGHILYVSPDHPAGTHPVIIDYKDWAARSARDSARQHLERNREWFFFTKHNAWAAEQECRLVAFGDLDRYEYIQFGDALSEIIVGEAATVQTIEACQQLGKELEVPVSCIFWRNGVASRVPIGAG